MIPSYQRNPITDLIATYRLNGLSLRQASQDQILAVIAEPERLANTWLERANAIADDPNLTPVGRAAAALKSAREILMAVEKWVAPLLTGLAANEQAKREEISALAGYPRPTDPAEAVTQALIRAEIRRAAAGLSNEAAENLYRLSDALVRAALDEAPRIVVNDNGFATSRSFVTPEVRDEVLTDSAVRTRPDLGDALHDIAEIRSIYTVCANIMRRLVTEAVPAAAYPETPAPRLYA